MKDNLEQHLKLERFVELNWNCIKGHLYFSGVILNHVSKRVTGNRLTNSKLTIN